ncbi:MAG: hypothetical protein OEX07_10875, partial [Gammaproteobacteria bacterium]|nr:hypothetical protein [Gammaproteobacteria bacterium]
LTKAIEITARQIAKKETQATKASVHDTNKRVDDIGLKAHNETILAEHEDYFDLVDGDEVSDWVGNQPFNQAVEYQRVMKEGTAKEINSMLSVYKKSIELPGEDEPEKKLSKRDKQLLSAEATRKRSGGAPKTISKNDFDSAWDEAPET